MADAQDSKSCGGDFVWVQVPSRAPIDKLVRVIRTLDILSVLIRLIFFYNNFVFLINTM